MEFASLMPNGLNEVEVFNHAEPYCRECREKILSWRWVASGPVHSHALHRDLQEMMECGKSCILCRYFCSLFGWEFLQDVILDFHADRDPTVTISYYTIGGQNEHLTSEGIMEYVQMAVSIDDRLVGTVDLEKRHFTVCTSVARGFGRPIWSSATPIDFDERSSTIREWLTECDTHHHKCREKANLDSPLAARVLSIQRLGQDEFLIKLVPTEEIDLHKEKYFVLSHVWGTIDIDCKTKRKSLAQYQTEGVSYEKLPPTFQDAVKITAAVGLRYLWIDSLCIVQDDEDDWQRESAKMASIFRCASLTISATSARNSLGGCNLSTISELATQFPACSDGLLDFAIRGPEYYDSMGTLQDQMRESTLNTRAWVFQEQILSLRTLHAAHSQFVWQCPAMIESEDGLHYEDHRMDRNVLWKKFDRYDQRIPPSGNAQNTTPGAFHMAQDWWFWVAEYMKRTMKMGSDQYAAIAGVVRFYQELTNKEPVVGLWEEDLALHLSWHVYRDDFDHKIPLPTYGARRPSWTWMSYPHGSVQIQGPLIDWRSLEPGPGRHDIGIVYQALNVATDISWRGRPLTSEASGTITIRGICSALPRPSQYGRDFRARKLYLDPDLPESIQAREAFDTIALVAYIKTGGLIISPPSLMTFYLVIEPVGLSEDNRYVRIGFMQIFRELPAITKTEYEPQGTWRDIVLI